MGKECIYKRKDGKFETRYVKDIDDNGKLKYGYLYGNSYQEVKNKREVLQSSELVFDINGKVINQSKEYYEKFNCKIDEWLRFKKVIVKESSYATYLQVIDARIRPNLGNIRLDRLTDDVISDYITSLQDQKHLSDNTIHDIAMVIKQIITFHKMKIDVIVPSKIQKDIIVFNKKEIEIIEKRAHTKEDRCIFGILLSLYTGIRIGELCALKKESFDLRNNTFTVNHTMIRVKDTNRSSSYKTKVILSKPKSKKSYRVIPIPDILKKNINFYLRSMEEYEYFLSGTRKPIEPRSFTNHYYRFLNYWGIQHKKFHTTRHTFATKADEAQMSTKALSEILGHSSTSITQSLYIHPSLNYKRNCMNNIYNEKN